MSTQRLAVAVLLGCLAALTLLSTSSALNATDNGKSHHLTIGSRVWGDKLLERIHVQKSYSWLRKVKETRTLTGDGVSKITEIQVIDQARDGTGAYATLLNGGPDQTYVTLRFKSQTRQGIDFIVEIYGKR